jgi:hypothetical protein
MDPSLSKEARLKQLSHHRTQCGSGFDCPLLDGLSILTVSRSALGSMICPVQIPQCSSLVAAPLRTSPVQSRAVLRLAITQATITSSAPSATIELW